VLTGFQIHRFRGIRDGSFTGFDRVNVLVGPNGCGKSSFLEGLYLLADAFVRHDPLGRGRAEYVIDRRNEGSATTRPEAWWHRRDQSQPLSFEAAVVEIVAGEAYEQAVAASYSKEGAPNAIAPNESTIEERLARALFLDIDAVRDRTVEERLWPRLFNKRLDKPLVKSLNEVYGLQVENLSLGTDRMLHIGLPDVGLPITSLGAGVRIGLRLLMCSLVVEKSMLLLEEVDAFQSRSSLTKLALALTQASKQSDVQIFVTTHRHQTVDAFLRAGTSADVEVRVVPFVAGTDGVVRARAIPRDDAVALVDTGTDLRDIYRSIQVE
jgi:hypothetical protein